MHQLEAILRTALVRVEPSTLVCAKLRGGDWPTEMTLLALGKSAVPMALAAKRELGTKIVDEVVIAPQIPSGSPPGWMSSSHPRISERSVRAAALLLDRCHAASGPCLALMSGGGSALAAMPVSSISLAEKARCVELVYAGGATIGELNVVRKHLSEIKGGRLAQNSPWPMTTLVLSDVPGDSLHSVASGPTLPDPSTYEQAFEIVKQIAKNSGEEIPRRVLRHLERGTRGEIGETPKQIRESDVSELLAGIDAVARAAVDVAEERSIANVELIPTVLQGSVDEVMHSLVPLVTKPGLWIGAGEATIELPPALDSVKARGGRAQHLAMLLATEIQGNASVQILVAGTDGIDGNSDAAGAIVDGKSLYRMMQCGVDPVKSLERFESARALGAINAQIVLGPTMVNHADIVMIAVRKT